MELWILTHQHAARFMTEVQHTSDVTDRASARQPVLENVGTCDPSKQYLLRARTCFWRHLSDMAQVRHFMRKDIKMLLLIYNIARTTNLSKKKTQYQTPREGGGENKAPPSRTRVEIA